MLLRVVGVCHDVVMPWSPEQLQKFEETSPSDASDALLDDWVAYLLSPQPRQEAPEIWGGIKHTFHGAHPSARVARQALLRGGDGWLPVARPEVHKMHINNNRAHTFFHILGGKHALAVPVDDDVDHQHRHGD